jgi:hypothetical protein
MKTSQWRSVVVDGNRDICRHHSARFVIIHIVLLAVFVFLGGQLEEIGGIGSNQGTAASTMMYGWIGSPCMCQTGADSVNATTSMSVMSSCRKYHGCERLWWEVPYPTESSVNSYVKSFFVAKTTPTTAYIAAQAN